MKRIISQFLAILILTTLLQFSAYIPSPEPILAQNDSPPADLLLSKAWEHYRKGKYSKTKSFLARIPSKYSDHPDINYLLGQIYYKHNEFLRAKNHLQKVLPKLTDPASREAVRKLVERSRSYYNLNLRKNRYSQFIILRTADISAGLPSKINHDLLDAYHKIGGDLQFFPETRVTVILYPFSKFRRIVGAPVWSGGVFDGKIHIPIRQNGDDPYTKRTLYHEYTHAVVYLLARDNVPLWFNEGLATYQEHRQSPGYFKYHQLPNNFPERRIHSLSGIDEMFKQKQDKSGARLAYEYSYSLIQFMKERYGLPSIVRILKLAGETSSFRKALEQVTNRSIETFHREWELWLRREFQ